MSISDTLRMIEIQEEMSRLAIEKHQILCKTKLNNDSFYELLDDILSLNLPKSFHVSTLYPNQVRIPIDEVKSKTKYPHFYFYCLCDEKESFLKMGDIFLSTENRYDFLSFRKKIYEVSSQHIWDYSEVWDRLILKKTITYGSHLVERNIKCEPYKFGTLCKSEDPRADSFFYDLLGDHEIKFKNQHGIVNFFNERCVPTEKGFEVDLHRLKDVFTLKKVFHDCNVDVKRPSQETWTVNVEYPGKLFDLNEENQ